MPRRTKVEEQLDFEISFYQKLLRAHPDFVDALIPLGGACTRRGLYAQGLEVDLRLTHLKPDDSICWYNLACSYSLLKRVEDGCSALRRSMVLGYTDVEYIRRDPDLRNLRHSQQFHLLVASPTSRSSPAS